MASEIVIAKITAPIICVAVLATLKPFLKLLSPLVNRKYRPQYVDDINAFNANSSVSYSSLVALFISILVYITISFGTETWVGESGSRFVALFFAILFFYFYFFLHFLFRATNTRPQYVTTKSQRTFYDPSLNHSYQETPISNNGRNYQEMVEDGADRMLAQNTQPQIKLMKKLAKQVITGRGDKHSRYTLDVMREISDRSYVLEHKTKSSEDS